MADECVCRNKSSLVPDQEHQAQPTLPLPSFCPGANGRAAEATALSRFGNVAGHLQQYSPSAPGISSARQRAILLG